MCSVSVYDPLQAPYKRRSSLCDFFFRNRKRFDTALESFVKLSQTRSVSNFVTHQTITRSFNSVFLSELKTPFFNTRGQFRVCSLNKLCAISNSLILDQARARHRATSPAIPGRRIGRADGLDLAFSGHFAKKSSNLGYFAKKTSTFCKKALELRPFCKKTSTFCKKVLELRPFYKKAPGLFAKKSSNLCHFAKKPPVILQKSPRI